MILFYTIEIIFKKLTTLTEFDFVKIDIGIFGVHIGNILEYILEIYIEYQHTKSAMQYVYRVLHLRLSLKIMMLSANFQIKGR